MTIPWQIEPFNSPFGDPGFLVTNIYTGSTLMFDLGDLHRLTPRQILKADRFFISHGHIDHLIGFDQILRLNLNRARHLHFYGPPGVIELLQHRLQGYTWNLTTHYELVITVHEITDKQIRRYRFTCRHGFRPEPGKTVSRKHDSIIFRAPEYSIAVTLLEHGDIPCLALLLKEGLRINFRPEQLYRNHWRPGPWLTHVREAILQRRPENHLITIGGQHYPLGEIVKRIALLRPGRRIAYLTDFGFTPSNRQRVLALIRKADLLLCEAAFLEETREKAAATHHLTAAQAGQLAAQARVRRLKLFHFSPRHSDRQEDFRNQAARYYSGPIE